MVKRWVRRTAGRTHPMPDIFENLNLPQKEAVESGDGPVLVVAGPGSGKTRVLSHRFAYLVLRSGVHPRQILAVTFTNKAAQEMLNRVKKLLAGPEAGVSDAELRNLSMGTFHALCARWLRRDGEAVGLPREYVIFDDDDTGRAIKQAMADLDINIKQYSPAAVENAISRAKNDMQSPEDFPAATPFEKVAGRVYRRYQEILAASRAADFDDLLLLAVRLFRENPAVLARYQDQYRYILVDEFQDTNEVQYTLVRLLAAKNRNLFVVGDADQSIYRWRGADYRNVQRFRSDFPDARTFLLEENYRSTQRILDAAMGVILRNPGRVEKRLFTRRGEGPEVALHEAYDENDEARFVVDTIAELTAATPPEGAKPVHPGQCAVMYRTNAQSRALEEEFLRAGLPYRLVGAQRFYGRREVKDAIAYLRIVHNPADAVSAARIVNIPPRGLGDKALEALVAAAGGERIQPGVFLLRLAEGPDSARLESLLPARSAPVFANLGRMLAAWRAAAGTLSVADLLRKVLADVKYREYLRNGTEEGEDRWENVQELVAVAEEFEDVALERFLEDVTLVSDQDTISETQDAPTLLTLHAAKGLEFPVVFIVGLDDGILPHARSMEDPEAMAEERRLFYVGITRAMDRLYLVRAFRRAAGGGGGLMYESRFLRDLPPHVLGSGARRGSLNIGGEPRMTMVRTVREPPAPARQPRYRAGMRIRHARFGEGLVLDCRILGSDEELTVQFDEVGLKRLDADAAPVEVLS